MAEDKKIVLDNEDGDSAELNINLGETEKIENYAEENISAELESLN